jgi:peptidoglycan/LPS O-acetylase OafA/YrhL
MFLAGLLILGLLSALHLYYISINPYDYQKYYAVFTFLDPYTRLFSQIWQQWQSIAYALCYGLCMHALLYGSSRLKRPFEWPVLRWIGLISFSLYMWHLPFILLYMNVLLPQFQGWGAMIKYTGLMAWILFIIFPISLTLYRWIEMPGMRLGEMLIQQLEKLKKRPRVDVLSNTSTEKSASNSLVEVRS